MEIIMISVYIALNTAMQSLSASHYYPGRRNQACILTIPESVLQPIKSTRVVLRFLTGPHLHLGGVRQSRINYLVEGHHGGARTHDLWIKRPEPYR